MEDDFEEDANESPRNMTAVSRNQGRGETNRTENTPGRTLPRRNETPLNSIREDHSFRTSDNGFDYLGSVIGPSAPAGSSIAHSKILSMIPRQNSGLSRDDGQNSYNSGGQNNQIPEDSLTSRPPSVNMGSQDFDSKNYIPTKNSVGGKSGKRDNTNSTHTTAVIDGDDSPPMENSFATRELVTGEQQHMSSLTTARWEDSSSLINDKQQQQQLDSTSRSLDSSTSKFNKNNTFQLDMVAQSAEFSNNTFQLDMATPSVSTSPTSTQVKKFQLDMASTSPTSTQVKSILRKQNRRMSDDSLTLLDLEEGESKGESKRDNNGSRHISFGIPKPTTGNLREYHSSSDGLLEENTKSISAINENPIVHRNSTYGKLQTDNKSRQHNPGVRKSAWGLNTKSRGDRNSSKQHNPHSRVSFLEINRGASSQNRYFSALSRGNSSEKNRDGSRRGSNVSNSSFNPEDLEKLENSVDASDTSKNTKSTMNGIDEDMEVSESEICFSDPVGNGSELFFSDPRNVHRSSVFGSNDSQPFNDSSQFNLSQPFRQKVTFAPPRKQGADSLAVELEDLAEYLANLKKSISVAPGGPSENGSNSTSHRTARRNPDMSDSNRTGGGSEPGFYGKNNDPKSRRRFSMAYRATDEVVVYPDDCFSFLALHGPFSSFKFFAFALFVSIIQFTFLIIAIMSVLHPNLNMEGTDNPTKAFNFIPSNTNWLVRIAQMLTVISYCMFAETSLKDVITAVELFPQRDKLEPGDKYWNMVFSCVLRGLMGFLTAVATFLNIITSESVVDTILDFLAMTFISDIGKMAFQLALWGKYGTSLEEEARRIEDEPMPPCMLRSHSWKRYLRTIIPVAVLLVGLLFAIICAQEAPQVWTTKVLRVQFFDDDLEPYNGCYKAEGKQFLGWRNRRRSTFVGDGNHTDAKIGFCIPKKQWYLFDNEHNDPCRNDTNKLAQSGSPHYEFDISSTYGDTWVDRQGAPLTSYFFTGVKQDQIEATCGSFLNDGICNHHIFNEITYDYDGGDCCASTCTHANCGHALKEAFGENITDGAARGFPDCIDPNMVPLTIEIQNIFASNDEGVQGGDSSAVSSIPVSEETIEPVMLFDCDDKNVLTLSVNKNMEGGVQTVMVEEGANCTMYINNSTRSTIINGESIWSVDYTIYQGDKTVEEDPIVILQENSFKEEYTRFQKIPSCYFEKLSDYMDNKTIYTESSPESNSIDWLRATTRQSGNSECDDINFIERYALSVLNFAAPKESTTANVLVPIVVDIEEVEDTLNTIDLSTDNTTVVATSTSDTDYVLTFSDNSRLWIEKDRPCIWETIECSGGSIESLNLQELNLAGTLASSIGLLSDLAQFDVCKFTSTSIEYLCIDAHHPLTESSLASFSTKFSKKCIPRSTFYSSFS